MVLSVDDKEARDTMLKKVRIADPDLADELEHAALGLQEKWLAAMPMVPVDFFIVLGEQPSPVIDFRKLATPHDLFGTLKIEDSD
jgi:hypothetical protein